MVKHCIVSKIVSIWNQPLPNMAQHNIMTKTVSIYNSIMANHGPTSHYDKHYITIKINDGPMSHCNKGYLGMKINHGQRWSNLTLWQKLCQYVNKQWSTMVILGFMIFNRVYIPWFYNIKPKGLILFPWVFSINLL